MRRGAPLSTDQEGDVPGDREGDVATRSQVRDPPWDRVAMLDGNGGCTAHPAVVPRPQRGAPPRSEIVGSFQRMPVDVELERTISGHLAAGALAAAASAALRGLGPQVLGYLVATLRDDDVANDVFGHFCEELWKSIGTFRGESSFKTWAYKLVMHAVGRHRRDPFRKRALPIADDQLSAVVMDVRSQTPRFQRTEIKDRIAQLRQSLEPEEQTLLFLRVDQELPWSDVAAIVSAQGEPTDAATLRKRFERLKDRLRKLATDEGLLDE